MSENDREEEEADHAHQACALCKHKFEEDEEVVKPFRLSRKYFLQ